MIFFYSEMAFFTSPPALSYFKQLKSHRGFILIENSRDGSIHTMNIGDMDICEARALLNDQYDQYRIDMGDSFSDTFSARKQSVTSEISEQSPHDQGDLLGGEAQALPISGLEDQVLAGDQEERGLGGDGEDPAHDGLVDPTGQHNPGIEVAADNQDDQTTPITLLKVFTWTHIYRGILR